MKKILCLVSLLFITATCLMSQTKRTYNYDSSHKYDLVSNLEIGINGLYSYNLNSNLGNFGAGMLITKRISDYWRLRGVAEVNGFLNNGFDRFGKGMFGISFDLMPFYLYGEYGVCYNPSSKSKFGLAMEGGLGLKFKMGNFGSIYMETGVDRINNGNIWQSNVKGVIGLSWGLGITEDDRQEIDIDYNIRSGYGELKQENQLLKSEAKKTKEATEQLEGLVEDYANLLKSYKEQLDACKIENTRIIANCGNEEFKPILFDYATSYLNEFGEETVREIANQIINNDFLYMIEGYCSNNGDPYRNQKLSEERATTVFFALKELGVDTTRLVIVGNGMSDKNSVYEQKVIVKKAIFQ